MKFNKPEIMTKFATKVSTKFGMTALKVKKHSPEILLVTGIVGTVATTVLACKATLKLNDILDESKETIEKIHETAANEELADQYSSEDAKKDLTITYVQTGVKVAKLYAPAVIMGALSVTSILASHNMMKKRNVALAAAYATIDKTFKDYRGRVVERFGEKVDKELRYDIKAKKVEEKTVDPETGKEKKSKGIVEVAGVDPNGYSRFFDKSCYGWENSRDYNLMFLQTQQSIFNNLLTARGYVFLNDIYDALGIERTKMGQIVGWVKKNPNSAVSDGYIDFGITETNIETEDGYAPIILLDFNVDGNILDLI
jgi:hypothetical protein